MKVASIKTEKEKKKETSNRLFLAIFWLPPIVFFTNLIMHQPLSTKRTQKPFSLLTLAEEYSSRVWYSCVHLLRK